MTRNLAILFFAQFAAASSSILMVTLGGVIGSTLAGNAALATLPVSLMVVGTALTTIPAALLMKRIGRRLGFSLAAVVAAVGGLVAAWALYARSFGGFCLALTLNGINLAFVQQYRFAAAESVPLHRVGRAISLVLLGSIGGAIFGPLLATHGKDWVAGSNYTGTMLALGVLMLTAAAALLALRNPVVDETGAQRGPARPLLAIVRQPVFVVAVAGGVVGYGVMSFIMTATPISMHVIDGHTIEQTAGVIRSHVIAMYAPSLVSGFLIERFGTGRMMAAGALAMLATAVIGLQGQAVMHYWVALVLLGVGWNFLYVGGTTLLTRCYRNAERFKSQAVNDFSVFGFSAAGSLLAGTVIHFFGWSMLMFVVMPPLAAMLLALFVMRSRDELGRLDAESV